MPSRTRPRTPSFFQRFVRINPRCLPRRSTTEQNACKRGREQSKYEYLHIQTHIRFRGQSVGRHLRHHDPEHHRAQPNSQHAAEHRQNQTLSQELAEHMPARYSERSAHRYFFQPCHPLGQYQVRHVPACNQKNESHRPHQQPENPPCLNRKEVVVQLLHTGAPALITFGMVLSDTVGNDLHVGLRLGQSHARLHAPHHQQPVKVMVDLFGLECQWNHELILEPVSLPRSQYSYHRVGFVVHPDRFANDVVIGAQVFPKLVHEDNLVLLARHALLRQKIASEKKLVSGHGQKSWRLRTTPDLFWWSRCCEVKAGAAPRVNVLKRLVLLLPV